MTSKEKKKGEMGTLPNVFYEASITLVPKPDKGIIGKIIKTKQIKIKNTHTDICYEYRSKILSKINQVSY